MESRFVEVQKHSGERLRRYLSEQKLLNRDVRPKAADATLQIPIIREPDAAELAEIERIAGCKLHVGVGEFEKVQRRPAIEDLLGFSPSFEVIGDIAILIPPQEVTVREAANAILAVNKAIKTVAIPKTPISGDFRVRSFECVAGIPLHEVCIKEHGNRFKFDIEKVYFSPRLATERQRVASQIKRDEFVVDMFAGVGPYTIPVAKRAFKVYAIDINPDAVKYLKENLSLNHIENVEVREGDVRESTSDLVNIADRAIMNLPLQAFEFLDVALSIVKSGGVIHFYDTRRDDDLFDGLTRELESIAGEIEVLERRIVRSYAPHLYTVVIDFVVKERF
ncbi:MAG: class I SAM-dependent methyltransferase [Candidatus Syntropharchaeales archaeon]